MTRCIESNYDYLTNDWLEDHRFTTSAVLFLQQAGRRGTDRGMFGVLPPLLLLWSMLRWERKLGIAVLDECGVNRRLLEEDVDQELSAYPRSDHYHYVDYSRIGEVAALAIQEACRLGHNYVGSEHLILGLCAIQDEVLVRLFRKHRIQPAEFTKKLFALLKADT